MTAPAATAGKARAGGRARTTTRSVPLLARPLASYYLVLGVTLLLVALGLVMVLSASSVEAFSSSGSAFSIVDKQALWVIIGLPAMWAASRVPPKAWRMLGYPLLLLSVVLLVAVLVPGVGRTAGGATRWIDLPMGLQVQPSEPAKFGLVLWGADLLARKEKLLTDWKHVILPLVPVTAVLAMLVVLEPDLGTAVVLLAILLAMIWVSGAPGRILAWLGVSTVSVVALLAVAEPYRMRRLTSFTDPFNDPSNTGYQAIHGLYAMASGGWWGVGLGASREKWAYLPNAYTDYIYAIIGEELGLLGTLAVLGLFGLLGYAGVRIAIRSSDRFVQLAATGVTAWLLCQALVNIGYVIGLLPVTGIPLPLVSFGGSALLPTLIALGMLLSFARREPGAAEALAARGPGPVRRLGGRFARPRRRALAVATPQREVQRSAAERRPMTRAVPPRGPSARGAGRRPGGRPAARRSPR
jgi:cell division protein FtsW